MLPFVLDFQTPMDGSLGSFSFTYFYFFYIIAVLGVHCDIYKSSYNKSLDLFLYSAFTHTHAQHICTSIPDICIHTSFMPM
jgi:hypothetical protein